MDFKTVFPIQIYGRPPCRKIGDGQTRVIFYINFVELETSVPYVKFQDHRTSWSEEDDFKRFLPYLVMVAILVM